MFLAVSTVVAGIGVSATASIFAIGIWLGKLEGAVDTLKEGQNKLDKKMDQQFDKLDQKMNKQVEKLTRKIDHLCMLGLGSTAVYMTLNRR